MRSYRYHLVNVFAEQRFAGNQLAVFEDGSGLSDEDMQAIAQQLNLSETTFLLPSDQATAAVRILTPDGELPFAGHPTLGTAHIVRHLHQTGDQVTLAMRAGVIPVQACGDVWTLQARAPSWRTVPATPAELAAAFNLAASDFDAPAMFVNAGVEQTIVPLTSKQAVFAAKPNYALMQNHTRNQVGWTNALLWHRDGDIVTARFFFDVQGMAREDPGTGSACANLGGWLLANGVKGPLRLTVEQGHMIHRINHLYLTLDDHDQIHVGGRVVYIGDGTICL
ncbi:PhzF family phenazine biosynthesis protein [Chitinivorax tropicus]|uniref:PhzF family phenazine biosynthesis protein n=2 Tax=Chitinivorax tropicus TaxID=714531 RepID=A0A840MD11_9PROT|nr:PhzF family phenazine biosynthesis protein [Chitinivorax tropicus]